MTIVTMNAKLASILLLAIACACTAQAQTTTFTYQGRLQSDDADFSGTAEFQISLWDAFEGGAQLVATTPETISGAVKDGLFMLPLDFGSEPFAGGEDRWLQIALRTGLGEFQVLTPRQRILPVPYAITAGQVSGPIEAGQLSGMLPAASLSGTFDEPMVLNNSANSFIGNGSGLTGLTKMQVGLGNADNTSDLDKPISTATQSALEGKLANVSEDTTPQLGGGLDAQGNDITGASLLSAANLSISGGYGLINADAVIHRVTGNQFTNIIVPVFTNLFAILESGDDVYVNVLAEFDPNPWYYTSDLSAIADGTPGYIKGKQNIRFFAGRPGAGINLMSYGHGFTLESTTNIAFYGLHFNGSTNGLDTEGIAGMINHRSPAGVTNKLTIVVGNTLGTIPNQFVTHTWSDGGRKSEQWIVQNNTLLPGGSIGVPLHPGTGLNDGSFVSGAPHNSIIENNTLLGGTLYGPVIEPDGAGSSNAHSNRLFGFTTIRGNKMDGIYGTGIIVLGNNSNVIQAITIEDNYLKEMETGYRPAEDSLIKIYGGTDIKVLNNTTIAGVRGASNYPRHGLSVGTTIGLPGAVWNTNITVVGNTFIGGTIGIRAHKFVGGKFNGNTFKNQGFAGIWPWGVGGQIKDNYFDGQGLVNADAYAVHVFMNSTDPMSDWEIDGNIVNDTQDTPTTDGIYRQNLNGNTAERIFLGANFGTRLQSGATVYNYRTPRDGIIRQLPIESGAAFGDHVHVNGNILASGTITSSSDRNLKKEFAGVDPEEVLNQVLLLPIQVWTFRGEDAAVRHLGPMAQDFHAAFGLGANDTTIATVDADGVAMAAIQGLNRKLEDRLEQMETEIAELRAQRLEFLRRLEELEQRLR